MQPRTVAHCCEKPPVNGPGLRHPISSSHMVCAYLRNSPFGAMIGKEHKSRVLCGVAPSPPLSSSSLVSSSVRRTIPASAVFRSRRSKGTRGFSK